jgi:hypothetical protein
LNEKGVLEVFAMGNDNHLWHIVQIEPNGDWVNRWLDLSIRGPIQPSNLNIGLKGDIGVFPRQDSRLEVFVTDDNNHLQHLFTVSPQFSVNFDTVHEGGELTAQVRNIPPDTQVRVHIANRLGLGDFASCETRPPNEFFPAVCTIQIGNIISGESEDSVPMIARFSFYDNGRYVPQADVGFQVSNTRRPPPPPTTNVPNVIGMLLRDANNVISDANLRIGQVINPSTEVLTDRLNVTHQSPTSGTRVQVNSEVHLRVEPTSPQGIRGYTIWNCHSDRISINVYLWDFSSSAPSWQNKGTLESQWPAGGGPCGPGTSQPLIVELQSEHTYQLAITDPGRSGSCDDPSNNNCRRVYIPQERGDSNGPYRPITVS